MPPKRKRAEDATSTATTKSVRSSTRRKTAVDSEGGTSGPTGSVQENPPVKNSKTTTARKPRAGTSKGKAKEQAERFFSRLPVHDVYRLLSNYQRRPRGGSLLTSLRNLHNLIRYVHCVAGCSGVVTGIALSCDDAYPGLTKATDETNDLALPPSDAAKSRPAKSNKSANSEPYGPERATELFNKYADADDPSVIGADGFFRLCTDAGLAMEGSLPILLHWQLKAENMFHIKRSEWDEGTRELQIASLPNLSVALHDLEELLILGKQPLKPPTTSSGPKRKSVTSACVPYNRSRYYSYAADPKSFSELYRYCFDLPKADKKVRNIDMDTATAFWSVLLLPRYPLMQDILDFINEKKQTYKGVNKDLWFMVFEFCRTISPTLQDYDTDGAWPTMLDDFVTWKRHKMTETQNSNGATDSKASEHD